MSPKTPVAPREDVEALPSFCAVLERVASITLRGGRGPEEAVLGRSPQLRGCVLHVELGVLRVIHVAFGCLGPREMGEASRGPTHVVRDGDRPESVGSLQGSPGMVLVLCKRAEYW